MVGYLVYRATQRFNLYFAVFLAAALADLATYLVTSLQLALAFPVADGGALLSLKAFAAVFAITQVPLAGIEGVISALMFKYILQARSDVLIRLNVISKPDLLRLQGGAT